MPDLLLELFSEEIPARMQAQACADLKRLVTGALVEAGLTYEGAKSFVTPRRLALHVAGLPARQPDRREERKGPRVGAPQAAIDGFLKSAGLASLDQARVQDEGKKGQVYVAVLERPGRAATDVIADLLPPILRAFPWPKAMRWGALSAEAGAPAWVRPLHSIVCVFGPETEEPEIVRFSFAGAESGNVTHGHRFHSPGGFTVRRLEDYEANLLKAKVVLDAGRRKEIIRADATNLAFAAGLDLVPDEGLLDEVAGLVEWPVVLMGEFEERFLAIPPEVIRATIRANQKCFVLRDAATGALSNRFVLVANIEATDGGKAIAAGNARVVRARLSDALYFWETDRRPLPDFPEPKDKPLDQRLAKLRKLNVVFHEKLGTQGERVDRLIALADDLARALGTDNMLARRAAELCKADLMTEVVGEFPETQGLMGRRYAELQGEDRSVSTAIEEHYRPQGPNDQVPAAPTSVALALADKLDTLVGFWAIDEKPTGSRDPYALRRAALGIIRIVLDNGLKLRLSRVLPGGLQLYRNQRGQGFGTAFDGANLLDFLIDRLKVHLREKGARHDLIDAVLAARPSPLAGEGGARSATEEGANDDLLMIVRRVEALSSFLDTADGASLLAGFKRANNILRAEEKKEKDPATLAAPPAAHLRVAPEEHALAAAIDRAATDSAARLAEEDFAGAMRALARLRQPVDAFFEAVTVNADDPALRLNRLRLLSALRAAMRGVADFSQVAG